MKLFAALHLIPCVLGHAYYQLRDRASSLTYPANDGSQTYVVSPCWLPKSWFAIPLTSCVPYDELTEMRVTRLASYQNRPDRHLLDSLKSIPWICRILSSSAHGLASSLRRKLVEFLVSASYCPIKFPASSVTNNIRLSRIVLDRYDRGIFWEAQSSCQRIELRPFADQQSRRCKQLQSSRSLETYNTNFEQKIQKNSKEKTKS